MIHQRIVINKHCHLSVAVNLLFINVGIDITKQAFLNWQSAFQDI